jgi:hypothetical protein
VKASLFIILNENGAVLAYQICPNDKKEIVLDLFEEIWLTEGRTVKTRFIFTDNVKKDQASLKKRFLKIHPNHSVSIIQVRSISFLKV